LAVEEQRAVFAGEEHTAKPPLGAEQGDRACDGAVSAEIGRALEDGEIVPCATAVAGSGLTGLRLSTAAGTGLRLSTVARLILSAAAAGASLPAPACLGLSTAPVPGLSLPAATRSGLSFSTAPRPSLASAAAVTVVVAFTPGSDGQAKRQAEGLNSRPQAWFSMQCDSGHLAKAFARPLPTRSPAKQPRRSLSWLASWHAWSQP
jgi:hypothetical protein